MGISIDRDTFGDADYQAFAARLQDSLKALRAVLDRPDFGVGPQTLGAELEMSLIDRHGRPLGINRTILAESLDQHLQLELDRFNLEHNLRPVDPAGRPFTKLEIELAEALESIDSTARGHGGRVVAIGILPTLQQSDFASDPITNLARYRALQSSLRRLRQAPFAIDIHGDEILQVECESVVLEGSNTSFQFHLRVDPERFADTFNAAQLVTPLALAVSSNSPVFLTRRLWDETRIALFKQAVDTRGPALARADSWHRPARVPFGHGWVRRGAWELFAESVALHPPLIPITTAEQPLEMARAGHLPRLDELRLHQGTTWQWNRAIYDPGMGGHLRLEMRALPSGPTPVDMVANAAFLCGMVLGMRDGIGDLLPGLPFSLAEHNFYRSAQHGLDAALLWPSRRTPSPEQRSARDLVTEMLPVARAGLSALGVDSAESSRLLDIIKARVQAGTNGARWLLRMLDRAEASASREDALAMILEAYLREAATGKPVHEWSETL